MEKAKKATSKQYLAPDAATQPPTLLEILQDAISEKEKTDNTIALLQGAGRVANSLLLTAGLIVAAIASATIIALVLVGKLPSGFAIGSGLLGTGAVTVGGRAIHRKWKARRLSRAMLR